MNFAIAVVIGISITFMARFLAALQRETRRLSSKTVIVTHMRQERPSNRGRLVIMNSNAINRKQRSAMRRKIVGCVLAATVLVLPGRSQAQSGEIPASAEDIRELRELVRQLQAKVAQLEARQTSGAPGATVDPAGASGGSASPATRSDLLSADDRGVLDYFRATTINLGIDGYYGYNFNRPLGRVNLLRAYDVTSNSFSLNQANLIFEQAPDVASGRRFGARLDLQFGQATEAAQGNPANEPRPQVYRPVWQAYGTYVAPLGKGLSVDFGKWASPMGIEGNYSKDQMNYSRSFLFDALPFYHMGARVTYPFSNAFTLGYAVVNGVNQTEEFNGFKSQMVFVTTHPTKSLSWNLTYHNGQEQPTAGSGSPERNGRLHIIDSNVAWTVNSKLTLAAEGDYFINRVYSHSAPAHVAGGAGYARYQVTTKAALAARAEYLSDRGGLFSGTTQALKETTLTYEYKLADGFLMRTEWRRDFSNQPYFLTAETGVLKKEQNTATVGLMWWMGRKQGSW